jgi:hypothetical protein
MTLEELINLPKGTVVDYCSCMLVVNTPGPLSRFHLDDVNSPMVEYVMYTNDNYITCYLEGIEIATICYKEFINQLSIKPKKEESKMKTEFKQTEPNKKNTYPMFMKPSIDSGEEGYVVLFFKEGHGVVVSTTGEYFVNYFSSTWIMNRFTPVENCEVTFSNKE